MRNSIASYKESLSRIASDVLDAAEELDVAGSSSVQEAPSSGWRSSNWLPHSVSPVPNGVSPVLGNEVEQYKTEIERLLLSESEIKALAINYAAILKEKEAQLSKLHEENSLLKKNMEAKHVNASQESDENSKLNKSTLSSYKANQSPSKQKNTAQFSFHSTGNGLQKNAWAKMDSITNGVIHSASGSTTKSQKEADVLLVAGSQVKHEFEIKELMTDLKNEREHSADLVLKLCDEQRSNTSFQKNIRELQFENERTSAEVKDLQMKLDEKILEISQLQEEMSKINEEKVSVTTLKSLQTSITALQEENRKLKLENERLAAVLEHVAENGPGKGSTDNSEILVEASKKEKEEMLVSIQQLEISLKETCKERDKAQKELVRLKQHLLDKESEESEKMDEDNKIIEELRAISEHQKVHILKLEKTLQQEIASHKETKNIKNKEIQKSTEIIDDLKMKLANYMKEFESTNTELLNLQTALGQYYAESEAKERLERDLAVAKEESGKLSDSLKVANQDYHLLVKEKEDTLFKLSQAERMLLESKHTIQKLQEDNSKLHRAVEQSMTRINRMSMDSDFSVDRRIVIKLLVTYFQRNHNKEVLDLMVRMLGFSDEDKQRIGFAQQNAGRATVRGVFGLPGRLVGGILGGKSPVSLEVPSDNQSFADLWVDFLLQETAQRELRETEAINQPSNPEVKIPTATVRAEISSTPDKSIPSPRYSSSNPFPTPLPRQNMLLDPDSEFSTVPLASSASPSTGSSTRLSRLLQR